MNVQEIEGVFEGSALVHPLITPTVVTVANGVVLCGCIDGVIRGFSSQGAPLYAFYCQNRVIHQLHYLPVLDALVTVEGEGTLHVYRNWRGSSHLAPNRAEIIWPVSERIDSNQAPPQMDQIPETVLTMAQALLVDVTAAAACKSTRRIGAVVAPTTVVLLDVLPRAVCLSVIAEISVPCAPIVLSVFDQYIAFASQREVMALSLKLYAAPTEAEASELGDDEDASDPIIEAQRFVECRFDVDEAGTVLHLPSIRPSPLAVDGVFEVRGPAAATHIGVFVGPDSGFSRGHATLQLHRRFPISSVVSGVSLISESPLDRSDEDNPRTSASMRCFVSTTDSAFLYSVSRPSLLCTYTYEQSAFQTTVSSCLMFSVSSAGLDVSVLRTHQGLAVHGRALPPWRICQQHILGLSCLAADDDVVAFVAIPPKDDEDVRSFPAAPTDLTARSMTSTTNSDIPSDMSASLYILAVAPPATLAANAMAVASRQASPSAELAALADARHILLGAPVTVTSVGGVSAFTAQLRRKNRRAALRRVAGRLATCVLRNADYSNAATLFGASDRPLSEVFRALNAHAGAGDATLRYLDTALFQPAMADVVDDNPDIANEVLHFYASHAPQRLPMVVLESNLPVMPAAALDLLERSTEQQSSANEFARALLYLGMGRADEARDSVKSIPTEDVVEFVTTNPHLLFKAADAAAPLLPEDPASDIEDMDDEEDLTLNSDSTPSCIGDILREQHPVLLLEILLKCRANVSLKTVLPLIKGISHCNMLECYLEGVLRSGVGDKAAAMALVRAYIRRIRDCATGLTDLPQDVVEMAIKQLPAFHKTSIAKFVVGGSDQHKRHDWLLSLPPFHSRTESSEPLRHWIERLQAVLCSGALKHPMRIIPLLDQSPSFSGRGILKVLALLLAGRGIEGLHSLASSYPASVPDYAKRFCRSPSDWAAVVLALAQAGPVARPSYDVVLKEVSVLMPADALLRILPDRGTLAYHMPFVLQALRRAKADSVLAQAITEAQRAEASGL